MSVSTDDVEMRSRRVSKKYEPVILSLCLWNAICGGTLYMFPGMETDLMKVCGYSASDVDLLYSAGQMGVGVGFLPGAIFDRFGVSWSSVYAFVMIVIGSIGVSYGVLGSNYGDIQNVGGSSSFSGGAEAGGTQRATAGASGMSPRPVEGRPVEGPPFVSHDLDLHGALAKERCFEAWPLAIFYFCLQHGSVSLYQNGLFTGLALASRKHVGATAGVLAAGYGLSAAVWNLVYVHIFGHDIPSYVRVTGVIWAMTAVVGWFMLQVDKIVLIKDARELEGVVTVGHSHTTDYNSASAKTSTRAVPVRTPSKTHNAHYTQVQAQDSRTTGPGNASLLDTTTAPDYQDQETSASGEYFSHDWGQQIPASSERPLPTSDSSTNVTPEFRGNWRAVVRTRAYWATFIQFSLTQCVGSGLFLANLKLLTGSVGFSAAARDSVVTYVSLANCAGRLSVGYLMDLMSPRVGKARWMLLTAVLMISALGSVLVGYGSIFLFLLAGFAYGGNWAAMPAYMTSKFGKRNMVFGFVTPVVVMSINVKWMSSLTGGEYMGLL